MSSTDSNTSNLSAYDWKVYHIRKERMFKGTIAVCIIYGIIAATLMVCSYLFSEVRDMLFVQFLPFTIVYIIGTIVIILALIVYILSFEASKVNIFPEYPDVSCPDYWDMEILNESSSNLFDKTVNKDLFRYRCVLNSNLFNNLEIAKMSAGSTNPYSISDSYNITANKDIVNYDKLGILSTPENKGDNKFRHIYKNINDYHSNVGLNTEVYSNLLASALVMNNYEFDRSNNFFSNLQLKTGNQAIPPMSWKYDISESTGSLTGPCFSIMKDWNGITYDILKSTYGNNQIGVYLRNNTEPNKQGTHVGTISLDSKTSNILYTTNNDISLAAVTATASVNGKRAIRTPINKAILDIIVVSQTPAQAAAALKAQQDQVDALKTKINKLKESVSASAAEAVSDALGGISAGVNIDLATCINGNLSQNNSDYLGIPPPYVELIPVAKRNAYLPPTIGNGVFTSNVPLVCDSFYPLFMSYADNKTSSNLNKNALRCNYSKICGVPWSDMQCSSTADDYMADYGFTGEVNHLGDNGILGVRVTF